METENPVTTPEALAAGLTNEGGTHSRYRFLKNIMGMWLFQSIRRELGKKYTYDEMMYMAQGSPFTATFDPTDDSLLAPESMLTAIRTLLGQPELPLADVLASVYHSLAAGYKATTAQMEAISGQKVQAIHIVGGGSRDRYLNALTAKAVSVPVIAGPIEATAMGNVAVQLMALGEISSLEEARKVVGASEALVTYLPTNTEAYDAVYDRFVGILNR